MKKFLKNFFKIKYNRLSLFIYKKEFCRIYRHSTTAHSTKGAPQQVQSLLALEKQVPTGAKKERKHQKQRKKKLKRKKKIKLQHFKK